MFLSSFRPSHSHFRATLEAALRIWGSKLAVKLQVRNWRSSAPIPLNELKSFYDLIPAGVERLCFAAVDSEDIPLIARIFGK
ncbi:MAG: hypothetical protein NTW95_01815 [Candidatus Aminicenantes bacterium]|nr:hypothetical protein [Candidatus Aminicenantes bacterium]